MTSLDPRILDAKYQPFPAFARWLASTSIDEERWGRHAMHIAEIKQAPPEVLARAREVATRAAAIDTGAIEGLYEVDRGFTFTVAMEVATWESAVAAKGAQFKVLFESHLAAYEYVLDFATGSRPLVEALIRTLHEEVCKGQQTYHVVTEAGPQIHSLPKGVYKIHANHVLRNDGSTHAYCPVDQTPMEMQRFVRELGSEEFQNAHPVLQAAYSHFAFVAIHPFSDGNGRVSRALASVFTYRALSVPLVILFEHRSEYYPTLEQADQNNFQPFTDFIFARTVDSMQLVHESIRTAQAGSIQSISAGFTRLYVTPGGFTHSQIDNAASELAKAFGHELGQLIQQDFGGVIEGNTRVGSLVERDNYPEGLRRPVNGFVQFQLNLKSAPPADSSLTRTFDISVPRQSTKDDDIQVVEIRGNEHFSAPVSGCIPSISAIVQIRVRMFAQRIIAESLARMRLTAEQALQSKGY